jgi:hypothetical protein
VSDNPEVRFMDKPEESGWTLRDWFAGQALMGMLAGDTLGGHWDAFARDAYAVADAMLKARSMKKRGASTHEADA